MGYLDFLNPANWFGGDEGPAPYVIDKDAYDHDAGLTGGASWGQREVDAARGLNYDTSNSDSARGRALGMRGEFMDSLTGLRRRASGDYSAAAAQAQVEREQTARALQSYQAGQSAYDPAVARNVVHQIAGAGQAQAARVAQLKAQEMQAAQMGLAQALAGQQARDYGIMGTEMGGEKNQADFLINKEAAAATWAGLALQDKQYGEGMDMQYEQDMTGQSTAERGMAITKQASEDQVGATLAGGLMKAAAAAGAGGATPKK